MRCHEDRADPPLQKENANFCDFFAPRPDAFSPQTTTKSDTARGELDNLFGSTPEADEAPEPPQTDEPPNDEPLSKEAQAKKALDDLFK